MDRPVIVQSDLLVLLDERKPDAKQAREKLVLFMDAVRRAGAIHTYRMTPLTLWNAAATGISADDIVGWLTAYSRYELPFQAEARIRKLVGRYGKLWLSNDSDSLILHGDEMIMDELSGLASIMDHVSVRLTRGSWKLNEECRGSLKQELTRLGYPVIDLAGYHAGEALEVELRKRTLRDRLFELRDYQQSAVEHFYKEGTVQGGSGVIVLPCGAGKTIVGIAALARLGRATLILTSNSTSVKQWKDELLDKTSLQDSDVGQYCGTLKQVRPVTVATYNILTHRKSKDMPFTHMKLFTERDWGLIIYDEVHLLPAPVFRMTADIQATRRLGLTATLVREDGCAEDVYSLIGPKQFDMQWKTAEASSHIAAVSCTEIKVPLHKNMSALYAQASARAKLRMAAENPEKYAIVKQLLQEHEGKPTLIIGQYLNQLNELSAKLQVPLLTGEVPQQERQKLYDRFKKGDLSVLIVSKVANFAVDLPDAAVAIQLSGSFGSRQEEAQRIGRLLRPKSGNNQAWFYTIVTDQTKETEFAMKRQLFMLEQGYHYERVSVPCDEDKHEEAAAL
ncbi:DNA repair helicase XPB [Paenibacillus sp. LHD-38]|uniref:DNA repair helicase XPB n=1 Tax=Paenibacillus sp. LHD-38 TaxID=3072143 RepID=UPI00280CB6B6|nr:DNA repair helicase XPB [Paenibacillus sp. LHD-38]MDQ8733468.1 helicase-associated domain-containing protein [Paenibacillus sp. LHD-38]